jgi:hypothetical protein
MARIRLTELVAESQMGKAPYHINNFNNSVKFEELYQKLMWTSVIMLQETMQ